jgi:hypothetical protein
MPKLVLSLALLLALPPSPAQAQNNRSWVASFGSDGNPCTRASPCASFAEAVLQTNAGGEVNCVDQGDFFASLQLTITKTMTIDCEGVQGRMSNTSVSTLIIVQAGASDSVTLRGLDLTGRGGWDGRH